MKFAVMFLTYSFRYRFSSRRKDNSNFHKFPFIGPPVSVIAREKRLIREIHGVIYFIAAFRLRLTREDERRQVSLYECSSLKYVI